MIAHGVRCTLAQARASFQEYANYRADNITWACFELLVALVSMGVWRSAAAERGLDTIAGFGADEFTAYFLIAMILRQLMLSGPVNAIGARVRNGRIAMSLVRPMHPLLMFAGNNVAVRGTMALFVVPASLVLLVVLDAQVTTTGWDVLALVALYPFACTLLFVMDALAGTTGFWLVRNEGALGMYRIARLFLSGMFAPIAVYPDALSAIIRHLPFYFTLGYPVELATGRADLQDFPIALASTALWLIALWAVLGIVWRRGLRAHESVGL